MAIVPMKRMTFLTLAREGLAFMRLLQQLRIIHPERLVHADEREELEGLKHVINMQHAALLELAAIDAPMAQPGESHDAPAFEELVEWLAEARRLKERIAALDRTIEHARPWGDFDPEEIDVLEAFGIFVQLWSMDEKLFDKLTFPDGAVVHVVRRGIKALFATVSRGERISIRTAEAVQLQRPRLSSLEEERCAAGLQREAFMNKIGMAKAHMAGLKLEHEAVKREYDFQKALGETFGDDSVMAAAGWIPAHEVQMVREAVAQFAAPVVVKERGPLEDEQPPVLTRNPWIVRAFEPMLHLLGVPKYRGLDPALFFAPFMMLFFGVCMGDAGYGLAMVVAALLLRRFLAGKKTEAMVAANIALLFGIATIICGLVTGSIFGVAPGGRDWILLDVSHEFGDPMLLFKISIGLGILHLTIAFLMAAFSQASLGAKVAKLGSIAILWSGVLFVLKVQFWWALLAAGVAAVLTLSSSSSNIAKRLGLGLWNVYGHTSLLGDVMSYSRLFGLGIATGAIASVVNMLAGRVGEAVDLPVLGTLIVIVVLIVGHTFNLIMSTISSVIHPARLHAVEAMPKCVELTGTPYRPLAS